MPETPDDTVVGVVGLAAVIQPPPPNVALDVVVSFVRFGVILRIFVMESCNELTKLMKLPTVFYMQKYYVCSQVGGKSFFILLTDFGWNLSTQFS